MTPADGLDTWLGYAAATLTTLSFVPQAVLTLRTRDVAGISLGMYATFTVGVALWLAYGLRLGAWPLIGANAVTLVLAALILAVKLRERRRGRPNAPDAPDEPDAPEAPDGPHAAGTDR
jgi:MtN3 and saliva related transmembrane protein